MCCLSINISVLSNQVFFIVHQLRSVNILPLMNNKNYFIILVLVWDEWTCFSWWTTEMLNHPSFTLEIKISEHAAFDEQQFNWNRAVPSQTNVRLQTPEKGRFAVAGEYNRHSPSLLYSSHIHILQPSPCIMILSTYIYIYILFINNNAGHFDEKLLQG